LRRFGFAWKKASFFIASPDSDESGIGRLLNLPSYYFFIKRPFYNDANGLIFKEMRRDKHGTFMITGILQPLKNVERVVYYHGGWSDCPTDLEE